MRKKNRISVWVTLPIVLFLLLRLHGIDVQALEGGIYKSLDTMCDVMDIIQRDYIEKVSSEKLVRDAVQGMLSSLDSYSHFAPAPEPTAGPPAGAPPKEAGTYGLEVAYKDRLLTVVSPIEYGPAWKSGLKSGDIILKINDEATEDRPLFEFAHQLRSGSGKEITLQVARRGERDFIDVTITPGKIEGPAARSEMLEEKIGLLRISRFDKETVARTAECLKKLNAETAHGLIVDLRDCPAGAVGAAIEVADLFLPAGELITSLEGRAQGVSKEFKAKEKPIFRKGPFVVLINGGTSGAAEVLTGAIQGGVRGILMGQRSFGCAFEEGSFTLKDGSMISMITAVYQTPYGLEIQAEGIDPDVEIPLPPVALDADEEELPEKKAAEKKEKEKDKDKGKELDPMIRRAIDLIKGVRIVAHEEEK